MGPQDITCPDTRFTVDTITKMSAQVAGDTHLMLLDSLVEDQTPLIEDPEPYPFRIITSYYFVPQGLQTNNRDVVTHHLAANGAVHTIRAMKTWDDKDSRDVAARYYALAMTCVPIKPAERHPALEMVRTHLGVMIQLEAWSNMAKSLPRRSDFSYERVDVGQLTRGLSILDNIWAHMTADRGGAKQSPWIHGRLKDWCLLLRRLLSGTIELARLRHNERTLTTADTARGLGNVVKLLAAPEFSSVAAHSEAKMLFTAYRIKIDSTFTPTRLDDLTSAVIDPPALSPPKGPISVETVVPNYHKFDWGA